MTDIINEEENTTPLPEEEQETVVVDNGQTYESAESAIIAKEEADRAKLWAQESERQANIATRGAEEAGQAKDDAISAKNDAVAAKEYAEAAVTDANVVAVGTDLRATPSNIKTVANNISDVVTVSGISSNVTTVAGNTTNINTVAGISSNVTTVATNISNVNNVSSISSAIVAVSGISSDVTTVAENTTDISTVAGISNAVIAVANNNSDVTTVSTNISSINTTATNINAVNTAANNIVAIQNAPVNAQLARDWAVKMDGLVSGEDYSAKYWADQARQSAAGAVVDNISINRNTDDELQTIGVINQNVTTTAVKTWTGTKAQYDAIVSKDSGTLYYLTDVQKIYYGNTLVCEKYNRNIGEIITSSIPLTDAGLHLLDGSLIQGGGIYDDFVQYIAGLVNTYPQCFCSEAEWQQSVNTYGVCGKFVYSNNSVRLPKITGFIEGTIDSNALGDLVEAGLPNITGSCSTDIGNSIRIWVSDAQGAIYGDNYTTENSNDGQVGATGMNKPHTIRFDASSSSSIYGNSNTVQPQAIKVFYYIVVATTTKTDIEVDIDQIATNLNSKANDANVVHKTGNETITGHKIFAGDGWITKIQNTDVTYNIAPSSAKVASIIFTDKNGTQMGCVETARFPSNNTSVKLNVYSPNGNWASRVLELMVDANGNTTAFAPASDASNSIVTTEAMLKANDDTMYNYVKLGNGLLIQWGHIQQNSRQLNVTFPIPFMNTAYRMFTQDAGTASGYSYAGVTGIGRTTTGATLYSYYANRYYDWLAIGFWY